jgi:hypothetical protein
VLGREAEVESLAGEVYLGVIRPILKYAVPVWQSFSERLTEMLHGIDSEECGKNSFPICRNIFRGR